MECRGPKEKNKGGAAHQGLKAALALLLVLSFSIIADAQEKPDAAAGIYSVSRGALYAGAGLDLAKYRAVTIWCNRFSANFGTAPLSSGMPAMPAAAKQAASPVRAGAFHGVAHETKGEP